MAQNLMKKKNYLTKARRLVSNYLADETGQTSTEYILLLAVVGALIFKFKQTLTNKLVGDDGNSGLLGDIFQKFNADDLFK